MALRVWVARNNDTLRSIADQNHVSIDHLMTLNPSIEHLDQNIAGKLVNLPFLSESDMRQAATPPTCPQSSEYIDNWIPLTPLETMAEEEYDVLIVGTGAGGGTMLWRLCEQWRNSGKRIGIIERGSIVMPTHGRNLPMMNRTRLEQYYRYISDPLQGSFPEFIGAREVICLGGRTVFWDLVSSRLDLSLIPEWPVPIDEMETYYAMAERIMNVTQEYAKDSSLTENLLNRLQQGGFPESRYMPIAADLQPTKFGVVHSDVFFSSFSLLAKASFLRPFDLAINARAVQVLVDQGRATGVKVMSPDKSSYTLKAKTVVLSASTYETPRLLLHSGIEGEAIGHYMTNQVFMLAPGKVSRRDFTDIPGTLAILITATPEKPYQIRLIGPSGFDWYPSAEEKPFLEDLEILLLCFGMIAPRYENGVSLNPNRIDEYGVPEIEVVFSFSDEEQAEIQKMLGTVNQISSATDIIFGEACLVPTGDLHHTSGTCRMGNDPSTSVTDPYGQVHGISGLYVADNSVLPFIGSGNPTLTTVALAIRTADHIVTLT
ncbi:GMC family oxidoreductase N-terminal domain-containing protein [Paenibacillus sp. N4]|uniref:GMC oxidoreductase n=1 Tax=Paenibacillus vietnamensis TaxID=2590547 RepID=UPI001CD0D7A6|nr:GMC oxidoreductase [Paenibacillus vietnamensis]MCA0756519.1 GMC family oxidoreductase N-terminal domain-containing protein [Paenibacillus vietnamensis]